MKRLLNLLRNNANRGEFRAEANTLYVYDVIVASKSDAEWWGGTDAETFVQTLRGMSGDVAVRVDSPGGDVFAGRAMAQAIADYPSTVTVYVDGYAASAASIIAAAADKVVMGEGAFQMIHKAWTIEMGNSDQMLAAADLLEQIDASLVQTYANAAARRGKDTSAEAFAEMIAKETWLNADQAINAGLADEMKPYGSKPKAWDLSAYDAPPAEPEIANEIEQPRPNFAMDMLLRPAA